MKEFDSAVLEFMRDYPLNAILLRAAGSYDPAQGKVVGSQVHIPIECVMLDYTLQSNGLGIALGTDIKAGDKQLFVRPPHKSRPGTAQIEIDPTTDTVKVGKIIYEVVKVKEINPTTVDAILYELQLRR